MKIVSSLAFALLLTSACTSVFDGEEEERASVTCGGARPLEVIVKGRENRFGLDGQQVALNPGIPMQRICQRVESSCRATCESAKAAAEATGIKGFQDEDPVRLHQMGVLADDFNAALGLDTNFSSLGVDPGGDPGELVCNAKILEVIVVGREHRFGFDGRQVALNPAIPAQNICQPLSGDCRTLCDTARNELIASGVKGFTGDTDLARLRRMGEVADEFNAALGKDTNFAALGEGAPPADPAACNAKELQVLVKGKEHRFGFDGRQVALNPAIPMQNICQPLSGACRTTCDAARSAAIATGIKGFSGEPNPVQLRQMGGLADDFNAALGRTTDFENQPIDLN